MSLQLSVQPIGISWAFSQCTMAPACGSSEANSSSRRRSVRCCWGCWEVCQLSLRQGAKRVVGSWLWPLLEITALSKILSKGPSIHEHTVFYDILWYSMIFYDILYEDFPRVFPSSPFAQDLAAKLFSQNGCRLIGLFFWPQNDGFILYTRASQNIPKLFLPKGHTGWIWLVVWNMAWKIFPSYWE